MEETGQNVASIPDGKKFTSENQPTPEAKSEGWKKKRAEKLLTQKIIEKIIDAPVDDKRSLSKYVDAIYDLAVSGNPKAIDTINKGIEEEVQKIEHSGTIEVITGMEIK